MSRKQSMAKIRMLAWCCLAVFGLALAAAPAWAAAPVTVKVEVTMSGAPSAVLPAGDDPKHTVGMGKSKGEAIFSDGRKAQYSNVYFMDIYLGKYAKTWGYTKMVFKKGEWLFFKWDAAFVGRDKAGKPVFAGTGKLIKGTGVYKGIKGTVKFKNRQLPPSKELPKGGTGASAVITYTLP